jgi:hypothetical protein
VGVPFLSELVDYFHRQKGLPNLTEPITQLPCETP